MKKFSLLLLAVSWVAVADDDLDIPDVLDLNAELDSMLMGTVGDTSVSLMRQGDITTGRVGSDHVFLMEFDLGEATLTTGTVGGETVNLLEFGWEGDPDE